MGPVLRVLSRVILTTVLGCTDEDTEGQRGPCHTVLEWLRQDLNSSSCSRGFCHVVPPCSQGCDSQKGVLGSQRQTPEGQACARGWCCPELTPPPPPQSGASSFGEKFSRVKFSPSLTLFGGKPMEGWIAVTVSGLVTVSLLKPSGQVLTSTESLCRLRGRVALADIAFTGGGNIVVATADGSSASPVQFYKVCVSVVNEKCRIDTEILPSLFMRCTTDLNRRDRLPAITHLKFLARDMSEQVCPPGHPVAG